MWRVILGRDIKGNLSGSKGVNIDNFSISVKGWWKMVISYLKHSYLNWRANPCRKKNDCSFSSFSNFLNLAFLIFVWTQSNFSSAWHNNQFFFFFYSFFFIFRELSTLGNIAYRKWPSSLKHLFSCEDLFWKGWLLVRGCSYHFCPEKNMA